MSFSVDVIESRDCTKHVVSSFDDLLELVDIYIGQEAADWAMRWRDEFEYKISELDRTLDERRLNRKRVVPVVEELRKMIME